MPQQPYPYEKKGKQLIRISDAIFDFPQQICPKWYPIVKGTRMCCHYHLHEQIEIILLLEGHVTFQVNGVQHDLSANDILLINPFEAHSASLPPECQRTVYHAFNLNTNLLKTLPSPHFQETLNMLTNGEVSYPNRFYNKETEKGLAECLRSMLSCRNLENYELYQLSALFRFFAILGDPSKLDCKTGNERSSEFIKNTMLYIQNTDPQEISLDSVSKLLSYNKAYFTTLFKKNFGMPFIDFLNNYKIEMAKEYIRNGNYNLTEVATKAGFNYYAYFFRKFKLITGETPSDFAEKCRANYKSLTVQK